MSDDVLDSTDDATVDEPNDRITEKVQKNLNITERHARMLENAAVEEWGSTHAQGRVMEQMIEMYCTTDDGRTIFSMLQNIEEAVEGASGAHTQISVNQNSGSESDGRRGQSSAHTQDEVDQIIKKAHEDGEIDINEYDISALKGSSGIDWTVIIPAIARAEFDTTFEKKELTQILQAEGTYQYNGANEKVNTAKRELVSYPDFTDQLETVDVTTKEVRESTKPNPESYRDAFCTSISDYVGVSINTDVYATDKDAMAQTIADDLNKILQAYKSTRSTDRRMRIKRVVEMYGDELEDTGMLAADVDGEILIAYINNIRSEL